MLGPQRAYRPEISRQGCLQGCGCGGRRQYYCFRFNMNLVIHPIETPPRLLAGRGGGAFSRSLKPGPGPRPRAWLGAPDLLYIILRTDRAHASCAVFLLVARRRLSANQNERKVVDIDSDSFDSFAPWRCKRLHQKSSV